MSVLAVYDDQPGQQSAQGAGSHRFKSVVVACSGNLVEWYDFFAYAFTAIYFASSFFPAGDSTSQLLSTAGVFAVGFFMRPLGGWLFGWLADTSGRRISMVASVSLMCLGSLLVAVLPTYSAIGVLAPALLILARLLQGLSVGGEYGASATYMSEVADPGRRGLYSSFQYATIVSGQLLPLLTVVVLQQLLSPEDLKSWGWRVPFLIGALASVVVIWLRRNLRETITTEAKKREGAGTIRALLNHKHGALLVVIFTAGGSLCFYTFSTYMQKFLIGTVHLSPSVASLIMMVCLVLFMLEQPLCGLLSDRIGTKTMMIIFSSVITLTAAPILMLMSTISNPFAAFGLVLFGLTTVCFYTSISGVLKADLFPTEIRALGVGLPHAIANAIFGGSAEYVALAFKSAQHENYFFYYITVMALITFVAAVTMPDLRKTGHLSMRDG
jgi:metabolite-proton symporter